MLLAKEKLIKAIQTCLKNNNQPPKEKSIAILLAEESILIVMQTLEEKQIDTEKIVLMKLFHQMQSHPTYQLRTLIMEDEHLDTIPEMDSDKEIESSVKNHNLTLSESEDLSGYINPLYNEVLEDLDPILPGNEKDHFNVEFNLIESLLNKDTVITSPKIDFLLKVFADELTLINPIPPGIAKTIFDPKENICLIKKLSYDNSSPHPPEGLNSENDFKKIFNDDLAHIISPSEYEYVYADDESDSGDLTTKVVDDISDNSIREIYVHVPNVLTTLPTVYPVFVTLLPLSSKNKDKVFNPRIFISKEEKSSPLLSHRGLKVFQLINDSKSPMMIYGGDIPILNVPYLHFYPPSPAQVWGIESSSRLEKVKKEKEGLDSKLTGFESASKDLDTLLGSHRSDKNKEGQGYSVVPPSCSIYSPPKKDMSWTGLLKFADDTITDYSRPSPSIESNTSDLQNSNSSISEHGESSDSIMSKPIIKFVKADDNPTVMKTNKVETARKPPVKYAEMYRNTSKSLKVKGNQRNWNNLVSQQLGKVFLLKNKVVLNVVILIIWRMTVVTPNRTNMNVAQPKRRSFAKIAHSYVRRPFQRKSAVRTQSRVSRVSTADLGNKGKLLRPQLVRFGDLNKTLLKKVQIAIVYH
nr:hypothetical protein [Tanacetum cinerariifolium]